MSSFPDSLPTVMVIAGPTAAWETGDTLCAGGRAHPLQRRIEPLRAEEAAGRRVEHADLEVDARAASLPGDLEDALHERPPDPGSTTVRGDRDAQQVERSLEPEYGPRRFFFIATSVITTSKA